MTLHGDISVNHQRIGWWTAQRIATSPDQVHTYRWRAEADHGLLTGTLTHQYRDGAALLAALVLRAYIDRTQCYLCEWEGTSAMCKPLPRYRLVKACEHHHQEDQ